MIDANGKLTDVGSSRNVNRLMTNTTITKGVAMPMYMAPEVLIKEKNKKAADVYSFGTMMYECFSCAGAYLESVLSSRGASRRLSRAGSWLSGREICSMRRSPCACGPIPPLIVQSICILQVISKRIDFVPELIYLVSKLLYLVAHFITPVCAPSSFRSRVLENSQQPNVMMKRDKQTSHRMEN